jgi:hypothetical protein
MILIAAPGVFGHRLKAFFPFPLSPFALLVASVSYYQQVDHIHYQTV